MGKTKTCKTCGETKPATAEFFYTTKVTKRKTGQVFTCLRPQCKPCNVKTVVKAKHALGDATYNMRLALYGDKVLAGWLARTMGYSVDELRRHLELQFTSGMNWERFRAGDIHIDHIVPLKVFDRESKSEMKKAYDLPNIRPLWASENLAKSGDNLFLI